MDSVVEVSAALVVAASPEAVAPAAGEVSPAVALPTNDNPKRMVMNTRIALMTMIRGIVPKTKLPSMAVSKDTPTELGKRETQATRWTAEWHGLDHGVLG